MGPRSLLVDLGGTRVRTGLWDGEQGLRRSWLAEPGVSHRQHRNRGRRIGGEMLQGSTGSAAELGDDVGSMGAGAVAAHRSETKTRR